MDASIDPIPDPRTAALRQFMDLFNANSALLCLINNTSGQLCLVASYYVGDGDERRFRNVIAPLAGTTEQIGSDDLTEAAKAIMAACDLPSDRFVVDILLSDVGLIPTASARANGVLVSSRNPQAEARHVSGMLLHLSTLIELSRSRRISTALFDCQAEIKTESDDLERALIMVGKVLTRSMRAREFVMLSSKGSAHQYVLAGDEFQEHANLKAPQHSVDPPPPTPAEAKSVAFSEQRGHEIRVRLHEEALILQQTARFFPIGEFLSNAARIRHAETSYVFRGKAAPGYLQDRFSDTDQQMCETAFRTIEDYAGARSSEQYYAAVNEFLRQSTDTELKSPAALLALFERLSPLFSEAHVIEVSRGDADLDLASSSSKNAGPLTAKFQDELRSKYLGPFFDEHRSEAPDDVYIGITVHTDATYVAVHFSTYLESTRLLVLRSRSPYLNSGLARALVHLFDQMHVRFKRVEHQEYRASYITQVRHALVHHLAGVNRALIGVKTPWDKGIRQKDYWNRLIVDSSLTSLIDQASWSLNQARLLLENGRFIVGSIGPNTLNRKPMSIVDVVANVFRVLSFYRDEKNIVVVSRVRGAEPKVMNGDQELIQIAIMNLVDNAFKYSLYNKKLRWEVTYDADSYTFSITSASHPIDKRQMERIFAPFVRGRQKDHLNQRHGTGLGLFVASKILRAHSETCELKVAPITNDAELAGGANRFSFTMPYLTGTSETR